STVGLIGFLVNPANSNAGSDIQDAEEAALALGRRMIVVRASSEGEIEAAFGTLIEQQPRALLVAADVCLTTRTDKIVDLAVRHKLPMLCSRRECATAGGLMSYGANLAEGYRLQGIYAGRILKGEKPADLPVQQSVKLDLIIFEDGQGAWPRSATNAARPRQRGDRMTVKMKRRAFVMLLASAAAGWPLAARAQQRERMRRVGVLINLTADDPEGGARLAAFLAGLREFGWTDGRNIQIETRFG